MEYIIIIAVVLFVLARIGAKAEKKRRIAEAKKIKDRYRF